MMLFLDSWTRLGARSLSRQDYFTLFITRCKYYFVGEYWQNLAFNFTCRSNSEGFGVPYLQSHLGVEDICINSLIINSDYDNW